MADIANTGGRAVTFAQALVATGAAPAMPPIDGLASAGALTSDTIWDLTSLPERLVVLGGGSIGCELGQAFARLGSQVTIVEGTDRILPREDAKASAVVAVALTREGVRILTGVSVSAVETTAAPGTGGRLRLKDGSHVDYDELLVAVGRSPRTAGMGLAAAGVEVDKRGFVIVDIAPANDQSPHLGGRGPDRTPSVHAHSRCPWQPGREQRHPALRGFTRARSR